MSNNSMIVARVVGRISLINEFLKLENWIEVGYNEGKGFYLGLPENDFTHMLMKKRYYINAGTESAVNFLLNRYEEVFMEEVFDNIFEMVTQNFEKSVDDFFQTAVAAE